MAEDVHIQGHYGRPDLGLRERIADAVDAAGLDPERLTPEALAPLEEFHTLGRAATLRLADLAGIGPADRVLDVGAGLGGPARLLAHRHGCHVTAVDLTEEYCDIARWLNAACGLAGAIDVQAADALRLPFPDGAFDVVWTQHVQMNIADKAGLVDEFVRVLKPGGRLAQWDIFAGPNQPLHFPVPWAEDESISFLVPAERFRSLLERRGLVVEEWRDLSGEAVAFFANLASGGGSRSPLGLHVFVPAMADKAANNVRNLEEDRIRTVMGVSRAPA